jgi:hypothetical protein
VESGEIRPAKILENGSLSASYNPANCGAASAGCRAEIRSRGYQRLLQPKGATALARVA